MLFPKITLYLWLVMASIFYLQAQKISGVSVITGEKASVLPVQWRKEPISGQASPAGKEQCRFLLEMLEKEMKKYPAYILKENINSVQLVYTLEFFGKNYPGTYTRNRIWLAVESGSGKFGSPFMASVFHRELSSILLNNYGRYFQEPAWRELLPEGFQYSETPFFDPDSIDLRADPKWMAKGFINAWAASSLENDFNSLASRLLGSDKDFWLYIESYPVLMKKMLLCLSFYRSLDSVFTETYFRNLRKK